MVKQIIIELFCMLIKTVAAKFYRSLEGLCNFLGEKRKTILVHKMFLNELSHHMSLYISSA